MLLFEFQKTFDEMLGSALYGIQVFNLLILALSFLPLLSLRSPPHEITAEWK